MKCLAKFVSVRSFYHKAPSSVLVYKNPILDLQQYLEISIFKEKDKCFTPTLESLEKAFDLFVPKPGHDIKVLARTANPSLFPCHDLPEVTFLGRSNAGKSSLMKAIFRAAPDLGIRVSKKPGRTKSLHFYQIGAKLCLIDAPGYGYHEPKYFGSLTASYFQNRKNLVRTFLLTDGDCGIQTKDEEAMEMLEDFKVPYALVMTKIDKSPDSKRLKNLLHLQNVRDKISSLYCFPQPFMLSSVTMEGLAYFTAFIAHVTGNLNVEE